MAETLRRGVPLVLSAPSGTGKSTLARRMLQEFPNLDFSISCTTREPRPGEVNGRDYFFVSRDEFAHRRKLNDFAEWAEVHGNLYGTPLSDLRTRLAAGHDVVFDIDVQGAAQIRLNIRDAVLVFILPPSLEELEARLRKRGHDDDESIARRLENAAREMELAAWYDAVIVNDDLDRAYGDLCAVYRCATLSPGRNPGLLWRA